MSLFTNPLLTANTQELSPVSYTFLELRINSGSDKL